MRGVSPFTDHGDSLAPGVASYGRTPARYGKSTRSGERTARHSIKLIDPDTVPRGDYEGSKGQCIVRHAIKLVKRRRVIDRSRSEFDVRLHRQI